MIQRLTIECPKLTMTHRQFHPLKLRRYHLDLGRSHSRRADTLASHLDLQLEGCAAQLAHVLPVPEGFRDREQQQGEHPSEPKPFQELTQARERR